MGWKTIMKQQKLVEKMTIEEKAAILSGKTVWQTREIDRLSIPSIFLSDGPHGIRKQAGAGDHLGLNASLNATCFPTAATIANSWNQDLGEEIGQALGEEAASMDVNILLGPGLNIKRSPLCGRNFEYFSEDPYLSGKMAASYIRGIQSKGVYACPKHLAVNSQELRRMAMDAVVDERTLREIYLTGFEIAVKEGHAKAIMSSYNQINGIYANEDKHLLTDILRKEWGFDGIVVTDWGGSNDHVKGVAAGSNLEMPSCGYDSAREVIAAVRNGKLKETDLDERVGELVDAVMELTSGKKLSDKNFDRNAHHQLARKAAAESMILLKNEKQILPLDTKKSIAIIGDFAFSPRYQGAGSSMVNPTKVEDMSSILQQYDLNILGMTRGYQRNGEVDENDRKFALNLAMNADIVIFCFGLDEISESEGPAFRYYPSNEKTSEYRESVYVGYRYYDTSKVRVQYPFGLGLSYTEFTYSDLIIEEDGIKVSVTNTGDRDGAEVVQMYVGLPNAIVFRPEKELKGFAKVYLKAGESRQLRIPFDDKTFRYWNIKTGQWEIETGTYQIMVGASVADIRLTGTTERTGNSKGYPYNPAKMPYYYTGIVQKISDEEFRELLGHDIPNGRWSGNLEINDAICQMYYAKSRLARLIYRCLTKMKKKSEAQGKPDLNILFIYNMPFRGIAKMTGGAVSMEMVYGIVDAVNGHFMLGVKKVVGGYFRNRRNNKKYEKLLKEAGGKCR